MITAPRVANVQSAIEYIYPLVADYNAGPRPVKTSSNVNNIVNKRSRVYERRVVQVDADDESDFDGSSMEDSEEDSDD